MAMSRKHYISTARLIADQRQEHRAHGGALEAIDALARGMADIFADDNSYFDRARFLEACDVDQEA